MKRTIRYLLSVICVVGALSACATSVTRVSPDKIIDLSGRWNDTDSRLVAEEMMKEALIRPWIDNFSSKNNKPPTVIVGSILNRSHEHINVQTFTKDLERELTNSGRVRFVASKSEREELRQEREEQMEHSRKDTVKAPGREIGADYMLKGSINSIQDEEGGRKVVYFQVTLEMIDIESNIKVWFGDKKIKKFIKKRRFGF
ncbi:MAG: penicillin-binding protein activator LpoB [Nitrospira sp.]|nr:penicillin-binding protein activator LpoB [Candidatus Manganitrophaceae bacterium]HIL35697.1 penicillin-binding protein activator LpoB [Candidatus Manganitrophaceae bacterium]